MNSLVTTKMKQHCTYHEDIEEEPLHILDPGNDVLQDSVDRFCRIWSRSHRAPITCFFKLQASEVGAIVGRQSRRVCSHQMARNWLTSKKAFVVNERSGCLDLSEQVKKYQLDKTHFTINKDRKTSIS